MQVTSYSNIIVEEKRTLSLVAFEHFEKIASFFFKFMKQINIVMSLT